MMALPDLEDVRALEYLLGRPLHPLLSVAQRAEFEGQRVLITGAGGSVGSELARQVAAASPDTVILVDQSEYGLFQVERELRERWPGLRMQPVLCDVTRRAAIRRLFRVTRPDVAFHAAAYKHVATLEGAVCTAVATNALGSYYTAHAARTSGARFVLVSTDKASHPRSVMGASKRLAELLALSLADDTFHPAVVRFGNVLGSSGSVVEIMRQRITRGQPIQVTHPRVSRFFMSAGEAASLVMLVDVISTDPSVYWLDMGEPIEIVQLAQRLITLATESGAPPVPIEFTGLRPGEKLIEEFPTSEVVPYVTSPSVVYRLRENGDLPNPQPLVGQLQRYVATSESGAALSAVLAAVPEFIPSVLAVDTAPLDALDRAA